MYDPMLSFPWNTLVCPAMFIRAAAAREPRWAAPGCQFPTLSLISLSFPGYGVLKLDVKTKSQSGVVSTSVVSADSRPLRRFSSECEYSE